jgi:transposase InsO family protein
VEALVDTGAVGASFISEKSLADVPRAVSSPCSPHVVSLADGSPLSLSTSSRLPFRLGTLSGHHRFFVLPSCPFAVIVGTDFLAAYKIIVDIAANRIVLPNSEFIPFVPRPVNPFLLPCVAVTPTPLPPFILNDSLSPAQLSSILSVLPSSLFADVDHPHGCTATATHVIDTGTNRPCWTGLRPTSPGERLIVQQEIKRMLACNVIRPSTSPWASPIVLVKKKDNSTRFCVDYRVLNNITKKDVHPLPRISDMLEALHGGVFFSTLDAASGYWQIPMDEASKEKTAFICNEGLFQFEVMSFGMCNAPATYQRTMIVVLAELLWDICLVYLDDVLIFSPSFDQHLKDVKRVTERLHQHGFLLQAKKCSFAMQEVTYLGHRVSSKGLRPDPSKLRVLREFPRPTDVKTLRAFLGLAGYYRKFINGFSSIADPLYTLTRDNVDWTWSPTSEEAFVKLRNALLTDAVLPFPDFNLPFIVDCDASEVGMGAILSQVVADGQERPILMESRKFTDGERKWHIREKEALAIIFALEQFRRFVLGCNFVVRTDHSSLEWLMQAKTGRLCRWALRLAEFQPFSIVHRKGDAHVNVDALTRSFEVSECVPDLAIASLVSFQSRSPPSLFPTSLPFPPLSDVLAAQQADPQCQQLKARRLGTLRGGLLGFPTRYGWRPVLPVSLALPLATQLHNHPLGAHLGARRLFSLLAPSFFIPNGRRLMAQVTKSCLPCLTRKAPRQHHGLLASQPPSESWAVVAMDFAGPLCRSAAGNSYVLVFIDSFSKWVELVPTVDQTALTVINAFYRHIICRHGCPKALLSDNGPQFRSAVVDSLCSQFSIKKIFSSIYYPQGDGFAERLMRTMNNSLSVLSRHNPTSWDDFLPGLAFAYNATEHAATAVSPFELNTGRLPRLPVASQVVITPKSLRPADLEYARRLRNIVSVAHRRARKAVVAYWSHMKTRYDARRSAIKLTPGSFVLVALTDYQRRQFPSMKLSPRWSEPHRVIKCLPNGVTYVVAPILQSSSRSSGEKVIHVSRLLPIPVAALSASSDPSDSVLSKGSASSSSSSGLRPQLSSISPGLRPQLSSISSGYRPPSPPISPGLRPQLSSISSGYRPPSPPISPGLRPLSSIISSNPVSLPTCNACLSSVLSCSCSRFASSLPTASFKPVPVSFTRTIKSVLSEAVVTISSEED